MSKTFFELCRQADERQRNKPVDPDIARLRKLLDDDVSLQRVWHELNKPSRDGAPEATVEGLAY